MKTDLKDSEITYSFITSPGPGGQNVNKVASGVLLRFNVTESTSLSEEVKKRLIEIIGRKLTKQGDLLIKATQFRTQERNKQDAYNRLMEYIQRASIRPKKRKKTKPTSGSIQKRLNHKKKHGAKKLLRRKSVE
jgi:ribosome-associated protein